MSPSERICRNCGCSTFDACVERVVYGQPICCSWVAVDLCSSCARGQKVRGPVVDRRPVAVAATGKEAGDE